MIALHADWSVDPRKRWMATAHRTEAGWTLHAPEPVGPVETLFDRLLSRAAGGPVAFGIDCPLGLPRAYAANFPDTGGFPAFLDRLATHSGAFFDVAMTLTEISPDRPFYPARGTAGMTRASHASALGLASPADLSRACDRATDRRPAGCPVFWTLGANQSGKAAIAAWRDLLLPAIRAARGPALWPFAGPFRDLLAPGRVALAETYPADALRQLGLVLPGSKRRHADRARLGPALLAAAAAHATVTPALTHAITDGFGPDPDGEDRLDCTLGLLAVLGVLDGRAPDTPPPDDPWLVTWEGWVLGQTDCPRALPSGSLPPIKSGRHR